MKKLILLLLVVSLAGVVPLLAQNDNSRRDDNDNGAVLIPGSSIENHGDQGMISHTNHVIHFRGTAQATAPAGLSPAQLATAYGLTPSWPGLGSGTIAIVDAYHYPTAENDLNVFSGQFGLRPCTSANTCFKVVYATRNGRAPTVNCGWAQEAALDIEWAHAMAPGAQIVLVEAASSSFTDLLSAVDVASGIVAKNGGKGQVSMSWGGSEFSGETSYESHFKTPNNVVYFAASGDTGGKTIYPGVSPNVVSAGGTTLKLTSSNAIQSETGWSGSGGGPSQYFAHPSYQGSILNIVGSRRGVPDFSFDADPYTGVSVYDSTRCSGMQGWMVFGGTSVSSPSLAGIVNSAGSFAQNTSSELTTIYGFLGSADFNDITSGTVGKYNAQVGWDFVTGVGSNNGLSGK